MYASAAILIAIIVAGYFLSRRRFAGSIGWKATVTPLASIIGSGFLVIGPILDHAYGGYAPLAMAALCLAAYAFGAAIRSNIASLAASVSRSRFVKQLEGTASWALAGAYIISVAYYLNLFGAFSVSLTSANTPQNAKLVTSAMLIWIVVVGWTRGFKALERLEQVSVTLKLAIIAGLLLGLGIHFGETAISETLIFNLPTLGVWESTTLAFGLIVTVQGFETSRYLGDEYDAPTRIATMRAAQLISGGIYMIYICLLTYVFAPADIALSETAIIDMMEIVAPILPMLLVAAALAAQFSAAIADTGGSGGLVEEISHKRVRAKHAYILLGIAGLALTWSANVFEIISYASRAFAFYYALQALIAAILNWQRRDARSLAILFAGLALLGFAIAIFGTAIEG